MKLVFCSYCAAELTQVTPTLYTCSNGHETFNNPRGSVAVVFLRGDQALFSKRAFDPNQGKYDFPGGFLEYNEDPYDAAVREIMEETGVQLSKDQLQIVTAYPGEYYPGMSVLDLVFLVTEWEGEFVPQDDSAALEWKPLSFVHGEQSNITTYKDLEQRIAAILGSGKV